MVVGGNGPLHGTHRRRGEIVLANDAVAAVFRVCAIAGTQPKLGLAS
jgi:uncharacterized protein (DUF362 family)